MIKLRKSKSRDSRISLQQKNNKPANINYKKTRNILSDLYLILGTFYFYSLSLNFINVLIGNSSNNFLCSLMTISL